MTQEELEDDIYSVVAPLLPMGVKAVWAKQNAPRPHKPYVTLDFLTYARRIGQDEFRETDDGWYRDGLREFTLSVNCFGDEAIDALTLLQQGLALADTVEAFGELNLATVMESDVRDLSQKIEQRWERRAQMDITLYRTVELAEELDYFNKTIVNGHQVG